MLSCLVNKVCKLLWIWPLRDHQELCIVTQKTRCRKGIPNALGNKWHGRMQKSHANIQDKDKVTLNLQALIRGSVQKTALTKLNVPVADIVPEEGLNVAGILTKAIGLKLLSCLCNNLSKAREHPCIFWCLCLWHAGSVAVKVHLNKTACIPNLSNKRTCLISSWRLNKLTGLLIKNSIKLDVLVISNKRKQVITHCVSTILSNQVHRIYTITL